jgi:D-sedoheptulose 7-phosphate isomerase
VEARDAEAYVERSFDAHAAMLDAVAGAGPDLVAAAELVAECLRGGGKLLLCGNGGSAADAQHLAAEFVGRFLRERTGLPALALTVNTSTLTALGNDYGFDALFARQVQAHGRPGDVLVAISTSGGSPNILAAVDAARDAGLRILGMSGRDGGELATACDLCLTVPVADTPRIQEGHILFGHILCGLVDEMLC